MDKYPIPPYPEEANRYRGQPNMDDLDENIIRANQHPSLNHICDSIKDAAKVGAASLLACLNFA